ncbi:MAG TPA: hypothetical protein VNX26_07500 [Candidatus Acidoferrum sp.]|jgi:hypothetical protein|nr:hypothetical protein [Candidatus Acidoferrum sp.]
MTWFTVVVIVILVLAWRMLPALVEGYRGKKGGPSPPPSAWRLAKS